MSTPTYIHHVNLNTGDTRRSTRAEVSEPALVVARPLLDIEGRQAVPDLMGDVEVVRSRGGVRLTILDGAAIRCAIGVATTSLGSGPLWRDLHAAGVATRLATDPAVAPAPPWSAIVLADRLRERPRDEVMALVVLARVLGWAWLERGR